jgi:hypothetical protein
MGPVPPLKEDKRESAIQRILQRQRDNEKGKRKRTGSEGMCTVATFNVAGYESFRDNDNITNVAQYIGTHQDIERYTKQRKDEGEEAVVMGLQEHWLHDGGDMQEYSEHGAHMRYRTVPHIGDGRYHGGVAVLNAHDIDCRCEVWHEQGYGGSEGVIWERIGEEGNAEGHIGNVYFDCERYRNQRGIEAEAIWLGLTEDVLELQKTGWVVLLGDFNSWLGEGEDGGGEGRCGFGQCQHARKAHGAVLPGHWVDIVERKGGDRSG